MTQASHPDTNRLVYRIRTAITGESTGIDTARLAWQYAEAIDRANQSLGEVAECISSDNLLEAVLREHNHPRLLEAANELNFNQATSWLERCQSFQWRQAATIDSSLSDTVKTALEGIENPQEWLFGEYRSAIRSKKTDIAYRIISTLSHKYPENANAKEESQRLQKKLIEATADDIKNSLEELIPSEKPNEILTRYQLIGLPLTDSKNTFIVDALAAQTAATTKIGSEAAQVIAEKADAAGSDDWKDFEKSYLACEYTISVNGIRGNIDATLRGSFEKVGSSIARSRATFETNVILRKAIADLKASLNGTAKPIAGKKPASYANQLEKLRSLEKQTKRTSGQISQKLQAEIKEAYALAKKKKLPKLIAIAGGIAAVLLVGLFLTNTALDNSAAKEGEATALAALQTAETQGSVQQVQTALTVHSSTISETATDSPLSNQAELLEAWSSTQFALESKYATKTQQLATLIETQDPLTNPVSIEATLASLENDRSGLATDLGSAEDTRIAELRQQWQNAVAKAHRVNNQEVVRLQRDIATATTNASKAKTRTEFDRLSAAATSRATALTALDESTQSKAIVTESQASLDALLSKWTALASARVQLTKAEDLATYLEAIQRIHSFDILPSSEKANIDQTLRLQTALAALKGRIALPNDLDLWQEFAGDTDYLAASPELDADETAFIGRLANNPVFENVYTSTVQYFEGSADPQSEYQVLLVEPIQKGDSGPGDSNVSFNFTIRGFDEFGNAEATSRDIQFISRNDGSFWGFFYKPSDLSPESRYYRDILKPMLKQLKGGANRLLVLEQIDQIEKESTLAPAFRAYWQDKLIEFTSLHPAKWGLSLSPTLGDKANKLAALYNGGVSERLWLSTLEQTVPSPELSAFFDSSISELILAETKAVATLYSNALQGDITLAGHIQPNGQLNLAPDVRAQNALWTVNTLTGRIERMDKKTGLTPYAPVLRYTFENGNKDTLLKRTEFATGFDFSDDRYSDLLPPIFE